MTIENLRALHAVIGEALDEIERVYKAHSTEGSGGGPALQFPPLDVPYYSTVKNSAEVDKAEELRADPAVFGAANRIVAACGQITATVHKPFFQLVEGGQAGTFIAALGFIERAHIVEILREAGPEGLGVQHIAAKVAELQRAANPDVGGVDPSNISHLLRLLATHHWLREVKPDVFANNRLSSFLDSGKSTEQIKISPSTKYEGTDGTAAYTATIADETTKTHGALADWLLLTGPGGPPRAHATAFHRAFNTQAAGFWEWLEGAGNKARLARFGHAMQGTKHWEVAENIIHGFPWDELPRDSVVADIGGGIGSVSVILADAYPHLRFAVKDRASVAAIAQQSWGDKHADLFSSGRVSFHAQDFLEPQTPFDVPPIGTVTHPDVFLLRAVAHNWPDEQAVQILKHLRAAAGPHTKLLIVDNLLPYACVDEDSSGADVRSLAPQGSPLLPNLGRASLNGYILDVTMMAMFKAKERTYREMDVLTRRAGWKIVRVKRAVGSLWAYVTADPV